MTRTAASQCSNFLVPAAGYDRLMGRYLPTLAPTFADAVGVQEGMRVLDVGCGPGGLTTELVARVGGGSVAAIDPSPPFVRACQERNPGADVREGVAEALPFDDGTFDATVSSLVVGFLSDAEVAAREMLRVTRPGGVVAACFWARDAMPALRTFWLAAAALDGHVDGELRRLGDDEGDIAGLLDRAGAVDIEQGLLAAQAVYADFDDWWEPFTLGVGPIGAYVRTLDEDRQTALRLVAHEALGEPVGPFTQQARAWYARGVVAACG